LIAFGITTPTLADVCKNVTFRAHNSSDTDMRIYSVQYHDYNSGDTSHWYTEDLPTTNCARESDCFTNPQNLGSAFNPRLNHDLANFEFWFAKKTATGWGSPKWSDPHYNSDATCINNRTYGTYHLY
jgi:hypothetical protein